MPRIGAGATERLDAVQPPRRAVEGDDAMITQTRRRAVIGLATLTLASAFGAQAQSDGAWPDRPIRLVVPFPPGGAADLTARLIGQKMAEALGHPIVVENRQGANGIIGTEAVARAAPDGYTLLLAPREVFGVNLSLHASLPYDPLASFAYVGIATEGPYVLVVNPALGVGSVGELVALAKARELAYGSFGIGSMPHLNLEAFSQAAGIRMTHVPYRGAAPAVTAVASNEVQLTITTPPSALGLLRDGRLRALAVGGERRIAQLPDVPALAETGIGADTLVPNFFGLAAPAGTKQPVIARLNAELKNAVALPDVAERLAASGLVPAAGTPEAMAVIDAQDGGRFAALVRSAGIRPE